ncbi:hypothetical protein ACQKGL_07565 [Ensifer adhaerens]|uniref:hypothetical protein n=1 Tax=Ensifer adhaerens TaxID=106592 RepID=UPI003CFBD706
MPENSYAKRRFIRETPETVMRRLPSFGKLMIMGKRNGVAHERIGAVESIETDGDFLLCKGTDHDSRLDPRVVTTMVVCTLTIMAEHVFPRLDFNGADGEPIFSVIGFDGFEAFETALAGLSTEVDPADWAEAERPERPAVSEDDAGLAPLMAAFASAETVIVTYDQPGFSQRWSGVLPKPNPAMGFINVMVPDFHLHLLGGAVCRWQEATRDGDTVLTAYDKDGAYTGLSLRATGAAVFRAAG